MNGLDETRVIKPFSFSPFFAQIKFFRETGIKQFQLKKMRFLIYPFLGIIWVYQHFISPLTPSSCRFQPTCSTYAKTAFQRFGFLKGFRLSFKRLVKCHPWGSSGFDPVPEEE